jgi:hypothetical protein
MLCNAVFLRVLKKATNVIADQHAGVVDVVPKLGSWESDGGSVAGPIGHIGTGYYNYRGGRPFS